MPPLIFDAHRVHNTTSRLRQSIKSRQERWRAYCDSMNVNVSWVYEMQETACRV